MVPSLARVFLGSSQFMTRSDLWQTRFQLEVL